MEQNKRFVDPEEVAKVERGVVSWLNSCDLKPVIAVRYEYLKDDAAGMCISTIQGAFKTKQYICGGYEAQYQFKIIYRNQAGDTSEMIESDELLNAIGAWCEHHTDSLKIGDEYKVVKVKRDTLSSLFAVYEDGSRDNQILMTLTYEVI